MNPYDIDFISDRKIYQIDPVNFNQYTISQFPPEIEGSAYENEAVLRSLLLNQNLLTKDLSIELYSRIEPERIYFILRGEAHEFFIFNFLLNNSEEIDFNKSLEKLKSNKDKILTWIRTNCQMIEIDNRNEIQTPFPFYKMPGIATQLKFLNKTIEATISSASFGHIEFDCTTSEHNHSEVEIIFSIGSSKFNLKGKIIPNFTKSLDSQPKLTAQLLFHNSEELNTWKTFMKAMNLREAKS